MPAPTDTQTTKPRRRLLRVIALLLLVFSIPIILFAPGCLGRMVGGKYGGVEVGNGPSATPDRPVRVEQTLPHTCGLRAMEAAYTAYGLDPEAMDLRYRLGTDFAALPVDPESTGTLHPDILRVLAQDGFATTIVDLEADDATQQLTDHLANGQLALAVVYRSTYHWVLLAPGDAAEQSFRLPSCRLGRPNAVQADGIAAGPTPCAVLEDVAALAGGIDAEPEARHLVIPDRRPLGSRLDRFDKSLRELGHAQTLFLRPVSRKQDATTRPETKAYSRIELSAQRLVESIIFQ